ncbi:triosephosphate isomerase [Cladophialophora psammophila CBS 110553]|uniref:Triosephosphate isomerase n=1 Tax=Cladophialophora psammophila CBS 110553 TaxID=1182543 RepID=W9WLP2_9EURO|nr:triosephosphate isomerase [Cladophialophora psammophila CBS 110553]EXJ69107.1 triosephosphate isomerase [Cladophialophora psammophila CBS 110553]
MSGSTPYPHLPSKLILTSTKAYFSPSRTLAYLASLLDPAHNILPLLQRHSSDVLFVLIPDFLTIYPCAQVLSSEFPPSSSEGGAGGGTRLDSSSWPIALGAQNVYPSTTYGAFTGEIVVPGIKELGCSIIELNHAERRRYLGENDVTAAAKAAAVCAAHMVPLVCIGELDRPDLRGPMSQAVGVAMAQLRPQIQSVLTAVPLDAPVIFAYEPVWAIGAAEPAGVDYVGPVVQAIREVARQIVPGRRADVKVVYGGSAGPGLWSGKNNGGNGLGQWVDGLFLGRFAHEISGVRGVVEEVMGSLGTR